jgi:putative CocE/NonD family hydrolase
MRKSYLCTVLLISAAIGLSVADPSLSDMVQASKKSTAEVPRAASSRNVMIPMRDGVKLAADIYVPSNDGVSPAPGRYPVLLRRTPYGKAHWSGQPAVRNAPSGMLIPELATSHGYVLVFQDVRGTFDSDGVFAPMLNEGTDGFDTTAWLAKQPWSDGRVATFGGSYLGGDQMLLVAQQPPGLVAAFSQIAATDQFKNEWVYMDGVLALTTAARWTIANVGTLNGHLSESERKLLAADYAALGISSSDSQELTSLAFAKVSKTLPLIDMPIARRAPWWSQWLNNWDHPEHFRNNEMSGRFQSITVPIMHVGGWYDLFLRNTYQHFKGISTQAKDPLVRANQRLLIGPWSHGTCEGCAPNSVVNIQKMQLAWMDQWFKGKKNSYFDYSVVLYVMGENRWRSEQGWPLIDTKLTRYYLHSQGRANTASGNGTLSVVPPTAEPNDGYTYDPRDPAPTVGGPGLAGSRAVQNAAEKRPDILIFSSPNLTEDVEVTGEVNATLYAASSATDTDWWIKLIDVAPDGNAYVLDQGVARARYRNSRTQPQPVTPGKIERYAVDMWATSNVFKKGHRIRVEVTSSNFPYADRNPNAFVDLSTATEKNFVVASQTIYHDSEHPSYVELPIIPQSRVRKWISTPFSPAVEMSTRP